MKLQTERTMQNTFKCQHGLDKICRSSKGRVIVTWKMNCFTTALLIICLSIPATGIPLEEGPVGGRSSVGSFEESFNFTHSGLPTFHEGPTEGRRPGLHRPIPDISRINTSDELINSSVPDSAEVFEIQHRGDNMPPAPANGTNRDDSDEIFEETRNTTEASSSENEDTTGAMDVTGGYQGNDTTDSLTDHTVDLRHFTTTDNLIRNPDVNQAITTDTSVRRNTDLYEAELDSQSESPENKFPAITNAEPLSSGQAPQSTTPSDTERSANAHSKPFTISDALLESLPPMKDTTYPGQGALSESEQLTKAPEGSSAGNTRPQKNIMTTQSSDIFHTSEMPDTIPDIPPSAISPEHQTSILTATTTEETVSDNPEMAGENDMLKKVFDRLESLENNYKEIESRMRQSHISMSHEILLLKEALALEQNKTKQMAFQMTHMMEAINDRLINITQKWTQPLLDLTNYQMGAMGCRYSGLHRSGPVTENATSTGWAPNDVEAELFRVTGAACSASIGARGYLERRTVPSKPELMQFRCTCTESRQAAVMRTCELHIWECLR